jgi:hypothetical protein
MKPAEKTIENAARVCAVSGKPFESGDSVVSYLLDDVSTYRRVDIRADAVAGYTPPRLVICRWKWTVKPRDNSGREEARSALAETEAMFLALYEEPATEGGDSLERAILKHLLALALQRKRILKEVKGSAGEYLHVESGATYSAPAPKEMTPEALRNAAMKLASAAPKPEGKNGGPLPAAGMPAPAKKETPASDVAVEASEPPAQNAARADPAQ